VREGSSDGRPEGGGGAAALCLLPLNGRGFGEG
jgi:hypothetical protein